MKTKLQEIRKNAGYKSAAAFAEKFGFNVATYTSYEQGARTLTADVAWQLADIFECTIDELVGRRAPERSNADPVKRRIIEAYDAMNEAGKRTLDEYVQMMRASGMYEKNQDNSVSRTA